jgi:hypothetical protein
MLRHALIVLSISLAGAATAAPIFPPIVSGEASVTIITGSIAVDAQGIPMEPPIQSVSLLAEGALTHCEEMGNDETKPVTYTILNNSLNRVSVVALAHSGAGCTGLQSDPSTNTAYYFFVGPPPPDLTL